MWSRRKNVLGKNRHLDYERTEQSKQCSHTISVRATPLMVRNRLGNSTSPPKPALLVSGCLESRHHFSSYPPFFNAFVRF